MDPDHQQPFDGDPVTRTISPSQAVASFSGEPPSPPWPELGQPSSPPWLDLDLDIDFDFREQPSAPAANTKATSSAGSGSAGSGSHKKIHHNAYERDRRKQLNELYSMLRSLLPDADHTKKLSIPTTVCQVLEYIPKLKKQVENLEKKKEELARAKCKSGMPRINDRTTPTVSATPLDDKQVMVHVSFLENMAECLPLSKCIQILENEGLQLITSSTFITSEIKRAFYNLHLQKSDGAMNKEFPTLLCDKLEKIVHGKAPEYLQQ